MFDKNDKTLFAMRVICIVTIIVLAAISTAIGILLDFINIMNKI